MSREDAIYGVFGEGSWGQGSSQTRSMPLNMGAVRFVSAGIVLGQIDEEKKQAAAAAESSLDSKLDDQLAASRPENRFRDRAENKRKKQFDKDAQEDESMESPPKEQSRTIKPPVKI
jgi:hypothetical protein